MLTLNFCGELNDCLAGQYKDHLDACFEGKMHDSPHPIKAFISSKRILELLHVDLFGAVHEDSLGGKKY